MNNDANVFVTLDAFSAYSPADYRTELSRHLRRAGPGDKILLTSMTFEPTEPAIQGIVDDLLAALTRGAHVTLGIDAHAFIIDKPGLGPLWYNKGLNGLMHPIFKNKYSIMQRINAYPNGRAVIINKPERRFSLPVAGRSHIKIAIVNDQVYIGGCNLQGSEWIDLMVGWQDSASATWLYQTMDEIITAQHAHRALKGVDRGLKLNNESEIIIDSGVRNQSAIFDEALALIDAAQKWLVITCQFFPNSITAQHLLKAHTRGVKVEVIFAHPKHHGLIGGLGQHYSLLREKSRLPKALFTHALGRTDPMLHAKLIACDKGVMIGSHNYVKAGVMLGTAEIALRSSNLKLARQAVATLRRSLTR